MEAEGVTSHGWDEKFQGKVEESLAVTEDDSGPVLHNIAIGLKDCFGLDDQNKSNVSAKPLPPEHFLIHMYILFSQAVMGLMAMVSLFIVLLLKASKFVRKVTEVGLG